MEGQLVFVKANDALRGYDASLYHFLRQGLKIPFQGIRLSKNLPSLKGQEDILKAKIQTENQAKSCGWTF